MKTIHFWQADNISNQKNNVFICSDSDMAAILHFVQNGRHETGFCKYLSKIFLESMKTIHIWKAYNIRNRKNNVSILPQVLYGHHLAFNRMAVMKRVWMLIGVEILCRVRRLYTFLERS